MLGEVFCGLKRERKVERSNIKRFKCLSLKFEVEILKHGLGDVTVPLSLGYLDMEAFNIAA